MKIWEREKRLRAVFSSSPEAITVSDLHGNIVDCNEAALRLHGYSSKKEIVGKNRLELIAEKDRESALKSLKMAFDQGAIKNVEYTFLKKDGEEYHGELSASILRDSVGNPACFICIIRDITERTRSETEAEQLVSFPERNPNPVLEIDLTGKTTYLNPAARKLLSQLRDLKLSGDFEEDLKTIIGEYNTHQTENFVRENVKIGDRYYQQSIHYIPENAALRIYIVDITEHKQWEDAVRDAKEKWASLTENTDDIVMIVDGNGVIQYINRTIPPYTPEETIGKTVYEYVPREQHDVFEKSLREVFKTGKPDGYEVSSSIPKIGTIWFSTKIVPIKHDGKVSGAILISADITERRNMIESLKSSEERLRILFESAPDGYYLSDLKGTFIDGNKAAEKITGYTRTELIGKSFLKLKLLPRSQILKAAKLLALNAAGKSMGPDELVLNRKDGTQVPVEIRTHPVRINDQTLVLGIARDITERKKAAEALSESEKRFKTVFEGAPEGIVAADTRSRHFVFANPVMCELTGYSLKELLKLGANDIHPKEDLPYVIGEFTKQA